MIIIFFFTEKYADQQAVCFFLNITKRKVEQSLSSKQEKTAGASKLFRVVKSRQECEKFTRET